MELREMILSGNFARGEKLPSEIELAQEMGISRSSLREAIGNLEREGLVIKKQGIGTFVTSQSPIIRGGIERLTGIMDFVKANGYEAQSLLISFTANVADSSIAARLDLVPGSIVYNLVTIKLASDVPVALCVDTIPEEVLKIPVKPENLQYSVFEGLRNDHNIEIYYAEAEIIPMVADADISSKLSLREGQAILLLEQIHFDENNRKILYSKSYFPSGKFNFKLIRRR
jgi:GntR family transcriptional regulator